MRTMIIRLLTVTALVITMGVGASAATWKLNPKPKKSRYRGGPVVISELVKTKNGYKLKHHVYATPPWLTTPYRYNYRRGSTYSTR